MRSIVARYTTLGEAEAARSALDAAGIECDLHDANIIAIQWMYANAVGWVKLLVADDALDDAMDVLTLEAQPEEGSEGHPERSEGPGREGLETSDGGPATPRSLAPLRMTSLVSRLFLFFGLSVIATGLAIAIGRTEMILAAVAWIGLVAIVPRESVDGPPPTPAEAADVLCPRCGSRELHRFHYRKLGMLPLLVSLTAPLVGFLWLVLPHRKCDSCGRLF